MLKNPQSKRRSQRKRESGRRHPKSTRRKWLTSALQSLREANRVQSRMWSTLVIIPAFQMTLMEVQMDLRFHRLHSPKIRRSSCSLETPRQGMSTLFRLCRIERVLPSHLIQAIWRTTHITWKQTPHWKVCFSHPPHIKRILRSPQIKDLIP